MKKILKSMLAIVLTASMLFVLSGCGNKEEEKATNDNEKTNIEQENKTVEFSMGSWSDNVYSNDFLGLKFKLPNGWKYSSDEEIAEMMNLGTELLNDEQKAAAEISKLNNAYYMVANDPNTGDNISIISEKPAMEVTTEFYINQLKTQLQNVNTINYEIGETSKETVAGKECDTLTVDASMSGVKMTQRYYIYKVDKYVVCIISTSTSGEEKINDMMKNFE